MKDVAINVAAFRRPHLLLTEKALYQARIGLQFLLSNCAQAKRADLRSADRYALLETKLFLG